MFFTCIKPVSCHSRLFCFSLHWHLLFKPCATAWRHSVVARNWPDLFVFRLQAIKLFLVTNNGKLLWSSWLVLSCVELCGLLRLMLSVSVCVSHKAALVEQSSISFLLICSCSLLTHMKKLVKHSRARVSASHMYTQSIHSLCGQSCVCVCACVYVCLRVHKGSPVD